MSEALHRPRTLPNHRLAIKQGTVYFGTLTDIGESFETLTRLRWRKRKLSATSGYFQHSHD